VFEEGDTLSFNWHGPENYREKGGDLIISRTRNVSKGVRRKSGWTRGSGIFHRYEQSTVGSRDEPSSPFHLVGSHRKIKRSPLTTSGRHNNRKLPQGNLGGSN